MRLTKSEVSSIVKNIKGLDSEAKIYLYGSRADDNKKGGDIDLLVVSEKLEFPDQVTILAHIKSEIGEQKIDLVIKKSSEMADPFVKRIMKQALLL